MHDLAISNALIVDGSGRRPYVGSLAVSAGRITEMGETVGAARQHIDAKGLALMPGIIDAHTHYDAQVTWDPLCDPSPALGVTTVVMGNCGFTLAPCKPSGRATLMRHLTRVEGMSLDALEAGIKWGFESFPEYLDMLQEQGVGPNVAVYIGHSALRAYVMGDDASRRTATDDELERMQVIVRDAMRAGAVGFSSSTHEQHIGDGGVPMPSRLADAREMTALAQAMACDGGGMLMVVKGSKTSVADLETLAGEVDRPLLVSAMRHHPAHPHKVFDELGLMREARERGRRLYGQCSCLPMEMDFTLENPYPFEAYDAWLPAIEATGLDAYKRVLADPAFRAAMKPALLDQAGLRIFRGDWTKVMVAEPVLAANRELEGRSVADLAKEAGKHPFDYFLDLGLEEDLKTTFTTEFSNFDVEAVGRILADPDNQISLGDGGAHLTFLCEAGFGLHLLGRWVRELGVLSLEEGVRRLTSQPANLFGMTGRGHLRVGAAADLLLFDPAAVGIGPKLRLYDLPAGATRLRTPALGVHGVWINGQQMVDETGMLAGEQRLAGQVIREFAR
ncbi:MAG: amidohydrolase family protein [Pigmentiphaga sp.]